MSAARKVKLGNTSVTFYPKLELVLGGKKTELLNVSSEQRGMLEHISQSGAPVEEIVAPSLREGAARYMELVASRLRSQEWESGRAQWRRETNFLEVVEAQEGKDGAPGYARYFIVLIRVVPGS